MMDLIDLQSIQDGMRPFNRKPVVYFLFLKGELRYIGQSNNFHYRIGTHGTGLARKEFDAYSVVEVPDGVDPEELEMSYILKFAPPANRAGFHPSTWAESRPSEPIARALKAVDEGMKIRDAAKQEGISAKTVSSGLYHREKRQHEANKLLLSSGDAGSAQEGIGTDGDARVRVHPESSRGRAKETRAVNEVPQGCLFD